MASIDSLIEELKFAKKMGLKNLPHPYDNDITSGIMCELEDITDTDKKPKTLVRHVGIEIECFSKASRMEVVKEIAKLKLLDVVQISDDISIDPDNCGEKSYELKILLKEREMSKILKKVQLLLKRIKAKTNSSCGLHVHLDMRKRSLSRCFENLQTSQKLLFGLVNKDRQHSGFCDYTGKEDWSRSAINRAAYHKHKTIEVRLHHGTVNMEIVENWVKLLLKLVNCRKKLEDVKNIQDLKKFNIKLGPKIRKYINKNYKKKLV